jgi:putative ABC transport system permease protein
MLSTFGGIIGYILGSFFAVTVGYFLPFQVNFESGSFWLSFLVSFSIGLLFSVGPAKSATKRNLLELMR